MSLASVEQMVGIAGPPTAASAVVSRKELPGLRKAAVFLAQLSKEEAGAVLAELRPSEVEKLTTELMRLQGVDAGDVDEVLTEFHTLMQARRFVGTGGVDFAREVLAAGSARTRPRASCPG
jgi:flagellar motor switch protein FliG